MSMVRGCRGLLLTAPDVKGALPGTVGHCLGYTMRWWEAAVHNMVQTPCASRLLHVAAARPRSSHLPALSLRLLCALMRVHRRPGRRDGCAAQGPGQQGTPRHGGGAKVRLQQQQRMHMHPRGSCCHEQLAAAACGCTRGWAATALTCAFVWPQLETACKCVSGLLTLKANAPPAWGVLQVCRLRGRGGHGRASAIQHVQPNAGGEAQQGGAKGR